MYQLNSQKLKASHLARNAYLYIRQSTLRQVYEHGESTKRQYALKQQAMALGWPVESIVTIDNDLGLSGVSSNEREGFQKLVAEVGMGYAGIVIGLEVSRLSRNSSDWIRLLEICAITDTLIMDEDGIYDTNDFNDRLLLGLKGTMSEAEIHFLQSRMRGGTISKAKRGELKRALPIGYMYNENNRIVMDPDLQVQQSINIFFQTFRRTGSAFTTVREFNRQGLKLPSRFQKGFRKGELAWKPLVHSRALQILHNPIYAGIYYYGRDQIKKTVGGKKSVRMPLENWHIFMPDAHPGYISQVEFEENLKKLRENAYLYGEDRKKSPAREGPALLQGIVICGKCGQRMSVRYQQNCSKLVPIYTCQKDCIENGKKICQTVMGENVDEEMSKLLIEMLNPLALEVALEVQNELNMRKLETDKFYKQQVERARYEMELARKRYMLVDPENRLVATELEAEWNLKIRELSQAQEQYEKQEELASKKVLESTKSDIMGIISDFPDLWRNTDVPVKEKKRIVRLLIEDVTLKNDDRIIVNIRFKGGTSKTLLVDRKLPMCEVRKTKADIVMKIDELTEYHTPSEVAEILNLNGCRSWDGNMFTLNSVRHIISRYGIKSRYERLREKGCLTLKEKMHETNLRIEKIRQLREDGKIIFYKATDREEYLYEPQKLIEHLVKI